MQYAEDRTSSTTSSGTGPSSWQRRIVLPASAGSSAADAGTEQSAEQAKHQQQPY